MCILQHGNSWNFLYSALQRCINSRDVRAGRRIHSFLVKIALDSSGLLGSHLIRFYALCGSLPIANHVFHSIVDRTVYTWNAIISSHVKHGKCGIALNLYQKMKQDGVSPDKVTYLLALKVAGTTRDLREGQLVHHQVVSAGMEIYIAIGNTLVDVYAKCQYLDDAEKIFKTLPCQDVVSWTALIAGYAQQGFELSALEMYIDMKRAGMEPTRATFLSLLKACSSMESLKHGQLIYDEIVRSGLDKEMTIGNSLIDMFAKCRSLDEARRTFEKMNNRDDVSWGAIIAGYAMHGEAHPTLHLFERMQDNDILVSRDTSCGIFKSCLKACANIPAIEEGRLIHDFIMKNELESDIAVGSSLIDMYAKCGQLEEAYAVFVDLPKQDEVSWGSMISGYANGGQGLSAIKLYEKMRNGDKIHNKVLFSSVLKGCASSAALLEGMHVHDRMVRHALEMDVIIGNTLIDMYVKCSNVEEAQKVFEGLPQKDEITWGTLILGCAEQDHSGSALSLLEQMQDQAIKAGPVTALCIIKACGITGSAKHGRWIHNEVLLSHSEGYPLLGNSLVDMYAKCGSIDEAERVFERLSNLDLISWGALISGYASHGHWKPARQYFEGMQREGLAPDAVVFTSILAACSHAGLLQEGQQYFQAMKEGFGIIPGTQHLSCMVSLLGRAGCLHDAEVFLQTVTAGPKALLWRSLLTSCRTYCNTTIGRRCFKEIIDADPSDASAYLLMVDIYADAQMWPEVNQIEELQRRAGAQKVAGQACIEVGTRMHKFTVGELHLLPDTYKLLIKLTRLNSLIKLDGSVVPCLDLISLVGEGHEDSPFTLCCKDTKPSVNMTCNSTSNEVSSVETLSSSKSLLLALYHGMCYYSRSHFIFVRLCVRPPACACV